MWLICVSFQSQCWAVFEMHQNTLCTRECSLHR
uniref:Uncharacterized protein n=1 Tax=Anguilla anguilla TaxID=7936 RepID=A0A0E9R1K8_ANGAN